MKVGLLVLATANPAKAMALEKVAAGFAARRIRRLAVDVDESGPTFAANAERKAQTVSELVPTALVLASDGGLEIPALGEQWNALRTSRFSGARRPAEKAAAVEKLLDGRPAPVKRARWTEALAVAVDGCVLASWTVAGPYGTIEARAPTHDPGPFWADAMLGHFEAGVDHWAQLAQLFREFCEREDLEWI